MIKKFNKVITGNPDIDRVQESIKATTDAITNNPVVQGQLVKAVTLKAGVATQVNHLLGRTIQGWHLSRPQTSTVPAEDVSAATDKTVTLTSPVDLTTDIYFY